MTPISTVEPPSDDDLVQRTLDGDDAAWDQLWRRHHSKCKGVAMSVLRYDVDAEDVLQNTRILAWHRLYQYKIGTYFGAWLRRICRNQALECRSSAFERHRQTRDHTWPQAAIDDAHTLADNDPNFERIETIDAVRTLWPALVRSLTEQELRLLRWLTSGYSPAEIGRAVGHGVYGNVSRVREKARPLARAHGF